ncbi:MAG: CSLREA domain-containing protein [Thioploca sp.]|nr:CSLREA domain-containing protein [Thioploca sp.]
MISTKLFKSLFTISLVVLSFQASAATITVNSTDDTIDNDGQCTLREAIENANNGSDTTNGDCIAGSITGNDIIYFAINGVINLKSELIVNSNIDFEGPGADKLTISGQKSTRVFSIGNEGHVVVSFYGVTIAEGFAGNNSNGGGIYNVESSDITIINSILSGNSARYGGAIFNSAGTVKIINSSILGDNLKSAEAGGGIYNGNLTYPGGSVTIEIINSTLSNNKVTDSGGAIYNIGKLTISNSTLSGNQADNKGGGIYNSTWSGNLTIKNSTLSANTGWGIFIDDEDTSNNVFIANTIIANNDGGDCHDNNSLTIKNTLIEDGSCNPTWIGDPKLGPLANNGGPTLTHALLSGSIAIDAGDNAICTAEPVNGLDQRGVSRFSSFTGSQCDIGAYEYQLPATITVNSTADTIADDGWCTLREAIENANNNNATHVDCVAGRGDDVIYFAINGVIKLKSELESELIVNSRVVSRNLKCYFAKRRI